MLNEMDNLADIARMLCQRVLCLILFFCCQLWRPSTPFFVIQSSTMMRFPGIKPMRDGETMHGEDGHQGSSMYALATQ